MKRHLRHLLSFVVIGLGVAAALDGYGLYDEHAQNRLIATPQAISGLETRPYLLFATAFQLSADGNFLKALNYYKQIPKTAPNVLFHAATFNSANLHLREAIRMQASGEAATVAQALPLLELAKQGYRDLLLVDPQNWGGRINLEYALRLAPEGDQADDVAAPRLHDRGTPTLKGSTLGMP